MRCLRYSSLFQIEPLTEAGMGAGRAAGVRSGSFAGCGGGVVLTGLSTRDFSWTGWAAGWLAELGGVLGADWSMRVLGAFLGCWLLSGWDFMSCVSGPPME